MKKMLLTLFVFIWFLAPVYAEIHVYGADGEYLGILLNQGFDYCQVYIPSMGAFAQIDDDKVISRTCSLHYGCLYYTSDDCTGTPYFQFPINKNIIYDQQGSILKPGNNACTIHAKSAIQGVRFDCEVVNNKDMPVLDVVEIAVESLPFSLPIQGPLELRYSLDDTTGDGKTGLEEAIQALQQISNIP